MSDNFAVVLVLVALTLLCVPVILALFWLIGF